MAKVTSQKSFEKEFSRLIEDIRKQATPFLNDTTVKKEARKKRSSTDPFFFAATYFPHYIQLADGYKDVWKDPAAKINWVKAGFADCHSKFFEISNLNNKFELLFAFRESAKDTLIAKIETIRKMVLNQIWFHTHTAFSNDHATSKIIPIKLEFEHNERLISDFGDMIGTTKWEESEFITKNGVKVQAFGRDETMRGSENFGHRPDWIIINDVFDPTKQTNPSVIQKYVASIKQDVLKSANSPKWGAVLLGNYVSKQSVEHELAIEAGKLGYGLNIFRAMVVNPKKTEEEREIAHQLRLNKLPDHEKSAWEFRHPTLRLAKERAADEDTFDAEMMMRPKDKKNAKFKDDDFHFYSRSELNGRKLIAYTFIDPSAKKASDYKAQITLGVPIEKQVMEIFVLSAWIRQESIDAMLEMAWTDFKLWNMKIIGVEMIGFASLLEREYLRMMAIKGIPLPIHKVESVTNKDAKIESLVPVVRSGLIKFDPTQGDQALLIRQFKGFPDKTAVKMGGIGDDGPDALYECWKLIQQFPAGSSVNEYTSGQKRDARFKTGAF
jgi:predicted phage terminase large subunit-like protein